MASWNKGSAQDANVDRSTNTTNFSLEIQTEKINPACSVQKIRNKFPPSLSVLYST